MTLERDLRALAAGFPDPPALVPGVSAGIARASRRRRRRRVAVLALALFLLVLRPRSRSRPTSVTACSRRSGCAMSKVEVVEQLPAVPPAAPGVSSLQLGSLTTLQEARNELRLRIDPPTALGRPDAIYRDELKTGAEVTFLYEPRTVAARFGVRKRVLVSVLRGAFNPDFLGKMVTRQTKVTRLKIGSDDALLILPGGPALRVLPALGDVRRDARAPCRHDTPVAAGRPADSHRGRALGRPAARHRALALDRLNARGRAIRGASGRLSKEWSRAKAKTSRPRSIGTRC